MGLFCRWRILVTRDLPSHLDHLVHTVPVDHLVHTVPTADHLVHMVPAVDHPATHPDLLSSRAQAREQPARAQVHWTPTTWSRRTEASGSGPRSARSGSGRQRQEPSKLRQLSRTLAHRIPAGRCCQTALGLARPPPGLPTLRPARGAGSWEVSALGLYCLEVEGNTATMEATTPDGSPNLSERW